VRIVEDAAPAGAELLHRVASREIGETARLVRPAPTVAFGRLDARLPGFEAAAAAARAHGFAPVVRTVGGHAAAYTGAAVVYEEVTPTERLAVEVGERFAAMAELVAGALGSLGVDARIGEIPGEYCPGEWSVSAGGLVKLAGIAQRLVSRAALVSAVIVAGDGARVRAVLTDVYAALGLDWDPATAGAVDDVAPGVGADDVRGALLARRRIG
jgi:lipoate-protein ligase A